MTWLSSTSLLEKLDRRSIRRLYTINSIPYFYLVYQLKVVLQFWWSLGKSNELHAIFKLSLAWIRSKSPFQGYFGVMLQTFPWFRYSAHLEQLIVIVAISGNYWKWFDYTSKVHVTRWREGLLIRVISYLVEIIHNKSTFRISYSILEL